MSWRGGDVRRSSKLSLTSTGFFWYKRPVKFCGPYIHTAVGIRVKSLILWIANIHKNVMKDFSLYSIKGEEQVDSVHWWEKWGGKSLQEPGKSEIHFFINIKKLSRFHPLQKDSSRLLLLTILISFFGSASSMLIRIHEVSKNADQCGSGSETHYYKKNSFCAPF